MDLINSFLKRQLNHRLITAILVALIVNAIFGFINMVLNYSIVQANADNLNVPVIVMYIFAPVVSFISLGANVFSMSLITYFVAAFLGFGFNYQQFVKLSARCCVWIPVMTLIDTLQFMIVGKRLISYSIFGLVCYIPFYFLIYHLGHFFYRAFTLIKR